MRRKRRKSIGINDELSEISRLGNRLDDEIGKAREKYSDHRVDEHISSFFELFILSRRENHLYPSPGDTDNAEDSCETDSIGDHS